MDTKWESNNKWNTMKDAPSDTDPISLVIPPSPPLSSTISWEWLLEYGKQPYRRGSDSAATSDFTRFEWSPTQPVHIIKNVYMVHHVYGMMVHHMYLVVVRLAKCIHVFDMIVSLVNGLISHLYLSLPQDCMPLQSKTGLN
jgi:hypothetical protein